MLLRRGKTALKLFALVSMVVILAGLSPLALAHGQTEGDAPGPFTAEPLPPSAFEPAISAPDLAASAAPQSRLAAAEEADLAIDLPRMPGIITVERTLVAGDEDEDWEFEVAFPEGQPRDVRIAAPEELEIEAGRLKSFAVMIDARDVPLGATRTATLVLTGKNDYNDDDDDDDKHEYSGNGGSKHSGRGGGDDDHKDDRDGRSGDDERTLTIPVRLVRAQAVVEVTTSCSPAVIARGEQTGCTVTLTNTTTADARVSLLTWLPRRLRVVRDGVSGGKAIGRDRVVFKGVIPGRVASGVSAALDPSGGPIDYVSLSLLGIEPIGDVGDETINNVTVPEFTFAGERYTRLGIVSNGYVVLGGGDVADISPVNTLLPDGARPNGTLAPFWTNLDPGAGGAIRVATVTDGVSRWLVIDYNRVPNSGQPEGLNSFQIWINLDRPNSISFIYSRQTITAGAGGLLTIGAESADGSTGATVFYNGAGDAPPLDSPEGRYSVAVTATAGQPSSKTISFTALAYSKGPYVGYSFVRSNAFEGIAVGTFAGEVVKQR